MKNYELGKDEVILYHGNAYLTRDGKIDEKSKNKETTEVILTNLNFVFTTTIKRLFGKEALPTEVYSASSVKFYREAPHILVKKKIVEVYFDGAEKFIEFPDKKQANAFASSALRLVSGKSKFVRAVKKVQKEIKETDEALDIDIVGGVKKVAGVTTDVVVATSITGNAKKSTKLAGTFIQKWIRRDKTKKEIAARKEDQLPVSSENSERIDEIKVENE